MRMIGIWFSRCRLPLCAQDWTPKRIVAISEYAPTTLRLREYQVTLRSGVILDANGLSDTS